VTDLSPLYSIGHVVYQTTLPSGDVDTRIERTVCAGPQVVKIQTEIVVEGRGASVEEVEALKARVSQHLKGEWRPYLSPYSGPCSWVGVAANDDEETVTAMIQALGGRTWINRERSDGRDLSDLYLQQSDTVRSDLLRWAHEDMRAQSLGRYPHGLGVWALGETSTI